MSDISDIFRLAGWTPVKTGDGEIAVGRVERRIGRKPPKAFRELLLLDGGMDFLRKHSNCDHPISCSQLGNRLRRRWDSYDPLREELLPFMIENQAVCTWAVRLDDADDSQVFVEVDSGSPPKWQLAAAAFAEWLACQVEDARLMASRPVGAQTPPLDEVGLQSLRLRFQEGRETWAWPGKSNYRFSSACSRLLIWNGEEQCDWWISPAPGASLSDALDELRGVEGLRDGVYLLADEYVETFRTWKN